MNVTIYAESFAWLFTEREPEHPCMWSFGRHRPPVEIGDDLIFRRDGWPLARAIVRGIYKPGECDVDMHDGSRRLTGWKVLWYQGDFEDLREAKLPKRFGAPLTPAMMKVLCNHDDDGRLDPNVYIGQTSTVDALIARRLVQMRCDRPDVRAPHLTLEGWRAALREISETRRQDIAHVFGRLLPEKERREKCRQVDVRWTWFAIGDMGTWCCRICGCTDGHGCAEGCSWHSINLCTSCARLVEDAATSKGAA